MFLKFDSNEERKRFGGSCFIEIQYCKQPKDTCDCKLVSMNTIENWKTTSLYIYDDDMGDFYNEYKEILGNGLYANLTEGVLDIWGINYYNEGKAHTIAERLKTLMPKEFEILLEWINRNPYHNGFYILGV